MSDFGRAFKTLKEARVYQSKINNGGNITQPHVEVRLLSKKLFPRRLKRYHVGTETDFKQLVKITRCCYKRRGMGVVNERR